MSSATSATEIQTRDTLLEFVERKFACMVNFTCRKIAGSLTQGGSTSIKGVPISRVAVVDGRKEIELRCSRTLGFDPPRQVFRNALKI